MAYPLILLTRSPYDGSLARAALDLALAFAVFDRKPRVLFIGRGVLQLAPGQAPAGRGSLRKVIDSFPLYDIEEYHVAEADLIAMGLGGCELPAPVQRAAAEDIRQLRQNAACVLTL
jgi:tRNA 2-thiouridine synthesizing protein C